MEIIIKLYARSSFTQVISVLSLFAMMIMPQISWAGDLYLHLTDSDLSGYAIYRMGEPERLDIRAIYQLGITQMMVLGGTAEEN